MNDQSIDTVRTGDLRPQTGGAGAGSEADLSPDTCVRKISEMLQAHFSHATAKEIQGSLDQLMSYSDQGIVANSPNSNSPSPKTLGNGKARLLRQWATPSEPSIDETQAAQPVLCVDTSSTAINHN